MARWTRMTFLSLKIKKKKWGCEWEVIPVHSVSHQQWNRHSRRGAKWLYLQGEKKQLSSQRAVPDLWDRCKNIVGVSVITTNPNKWLESADCNSAPDGDHDSSKGNSYRAHCVVSIKNMQNWPIQSLLQIFPAKQWKRNEWQETQWLCKYSTEQFFLTSRSAATFQS